MGGSVIIGAVVRRVMRKLIVVLIVFLISSGSVILHNTLKKGDLPDKKGEPDNAEEVILQKADTISGKFTGRGRGFVGDIEVMVFFESGLMTKIEVIKSEEIKAKWLPAKEKIIERVLSSQSLDVDVVTGATASSKGLLEAIEDARKKVYKRY